MKIRFFLPVFSLFIALSVSASAQKLTTLTTLLATPAGEQTTVAKLGTGKVTVVSFWSTACKPCKEEMKAMQPVYEKMKDKVTYIAISIDNTKTMAKVAPYVKSKGYTFPVLLDPNSELFRALNGTAIPYMLIFNADGTLHSKHEGYLEGDVEKLAEELETLSAGAGAVAPSTN